MSYESAAVISVGRLERQVSRFVVLIVLAACSHASNIDGSSAERRGSPSSILRGNEVIAEPSGVSFRIPQQWLDWNQQFHNNLHLSRAQLESVRDATGDWDHDYASVVNEILPFDSCAAHVGGEGWGRESVSFGDLQMRVYTGTFDSEKIRNAVLESGKSMAGRISRPVKADSATIGDWAETKLEWQAWYGDYGGVAHVDVLISQSEGRSTIIVFMYSSRNGPQERDAILKSVSLTK